MKISVVLKGVTIIFYSSHVQSTEIKILERQSGGSPESIYEHALNELLRSDLSSFPFIMRNNSIQSSSRIATPITLLPYQEQIGKVIRLVSLYTEEYASEFLSLRPASQGSTFVGYATITFLHYALKIGAAPLAKTLKSIDEDYTTSDVVHAIIMGRALFQGAEERNDLEAMFRTISYSLVGSTSQFDRLKKEVA